MKNFITTSFFLFSFFLVSAQINAITETGEEVILYSDGSWVYLNAEDEPLSEVKVNETPFKKPEDSSFMVKSTNLNLGVYINPKKWKFTKSALGDASEYEFERKGEDLYAIMITEKIEVPLESLKQIALDNARAVGPDIVVTKEEMRNVNGIDLLMLQMAGTIQGLKFTYFGYYYSNENGTVQLLSYTSQNLFESYIPEIEDFLNGVVLTED